MIDETLRADLAFAEHKNPVGSDLKVVHRRIRELKPDVANPRVHSKKQVRQIAASIEAFGFNAPVLVDREGKVIAGHGRLAACRSFGWSEQCMAVSRGQFFARSSAEGNLLALHPTFKPVAMVADAIARRAVTSCSMPLGRGATLIAVERTGPVLPRAGARQRLCRRNHPALAGGSTHHAASGRSFDDLAAEAPRRRCSIPPEARLDYENRVRQAPAIRVSGKANPPIREVDGTDCDHNSIALNA